MKVLCLFAAITGLLLSLYALHVESESLESIRNDSDFTASCDISEAISCSKVFTSEYGRLFHKFGLPDYPNALYGLLYYCIIIVLVMINPDSIPSVYDDVLLILTIISMTLSAYLAYVLANILNTICIVCFLSYLCNACIFICVAYTAYRKNGPKVNSTFDKNNHRLKGKRNK